MLKCKYCGKEIRFVATGPGSSIACDTEKRQFVTESGRRTYGYLIHECEGKNGEKESSERRSK